MVGQLNRVWVLGFKKGSKMVVMMDLDQNLFPSTASFGLLSVSIDNIMSFNIDVGVMINHSLCILGLGFVASLAIIRVIHNYGKFKFPLPSLNRERYSIL